MSDDDFDDIELIPDDQDEGYVRLRKEDAKALRSAARKGTSTAKELAAYKRQDAVRAAGIDGLSERQIAVIAREAEGDQSPENLRKIAEELNFISQAPPSEEEQQIEGEINGQAEAVAATSGAPAATHQSKVTPADVGAWTTQKRMRLNEQHPDLYERLLREEEVVLPPTFS